MKAKIKKTAELTVKVKMTTDELNLLIEALRASSKGVGFSLQARKVCADLAAALEPDR